MALKEEKYKVWFFFFLKKEIGLLLLQDFLLHAFDVSRGLPHAGDTSDVHVSIVPPQKCILVRGEHESRILKHFQEGATLHPFPKSLNLDSFIRQCWWLAIIHKSSIFPRGIHKITTGGQKQKKESTWTQQEAGSEQMSCLFIKWVSVFPK